jgi:hypothetical protein
MSSIDGMFSCRTGCALAVRAGGQAQRICKRPAALSSQTHGAQLRRRAFSSFFVNSRRARYAISWLGVSTSAVTAWSGLPIGL